MRNTQPLIAQLESANKAITDAFGVVCQTTGSLTMTQWRVLDHLDANGPTGVRELSTALDLDKSTVTRIAKHLSENGLISQSTDARDKRLVELTITIDGDAIAKKLRKKVMAFNGHLIGLLGDKSDDLSAMLSTLVEAIGHEPASFAKAQQAKFRHTEEYQSNRALTDKFFADTAIAKETNAQSAIADFIRFEIALTQAYITEGAIDAESGQTSIALIKDFRPDIAAFEIAMDSDGVPVPEFVRQLKAHAGALSATIHCGATSQDLIDTATILAIRRVNAQIRNRIGQLDDALTSLAARQATNTMLARTRMQAALPITADHRIRSWRDVLCSQARSLNTLEQSLYTLQLAGPVGTGPTNDPTLNDRLRIHVAAQLGLEPPAAPWHSDRSRFVTYGQWLATLAGALGKLGIDIALMSQQGIDEVEMSGGGTSSAMPHKHNPVLAEKLVTIARHVSTLSAELTGAMVHEQERSGIAWMAEWLTLPAMMEMTGRAVSDTITLVTTIQSIGDRPQPD